MKKFLIYLGIVVAFFVIGIVLANFVIMPFLVHMGEEIVVPNVCNLPSKTAIEELTQYGLQGVITERRYDPIIEKGKVIIQEPLPDEKVKKGRMINLTVSLGLETVKMPYLTGVDLEKGGLIIKRLGLVIEKIDSQYSDSIVRGKIIATIPDVEAEVKNGSSVTLIVSKGTVLKMPNVVGMELSKAVSMLEDMALVIGEIKEVEASGTSGNIIVQNPKLDKFVAAGDTVTLMVVK